MKNNKEIAIVSIFGALIVILQLLSNNIKFGAFPITLTLIPIILGGSILNKRVGSILGFIFGLIVLALVIIGADQEGYVMFSLHPLVTSCICIFKGILTGFVSSLVYEKFSIKNDKIAIILASFVAPIINTGSLCIGLILFFESNFAILLSTLMSINFIIELLINVLLAPSLLILIKRYKNRYLH